MHGTIYDFRTSPFLDLDFASCRSKPRPAARGRPAVPGLKVGIIVNPRSRRHLACAAAPHLRADVLTASPGTRAQLRQTLIDFRYHGIDLLVIDGGDGTVRDVLTCSEDVWGDAWPRIAVLPSGKTNALAMDLGIPSGWTLDDAIAAAARGGEARRSPIEVQQAHGARGPVRGFLFGTGPFVKGTELAQRTHRAGAFDSVAVVLALGWGVLSMVLGGSASAWRQGSSMGLDYAPGSTGLNGPIPSGRTERLMMFASTLHRLPAGAKPFGRPRPGLKTLVADASPRRLATSVPALLAGSESARLAERGYHRVDTHHVDVVLASDFILDGEQFPAGAYTLREGAPLRFVVP